MGLFDINHNKKQKLFLLETNHVKTAKLSAFSVSFTHIQFFCCCEIAGLVVNYGISNTIVLEIP